MLDRTVTLWTLTRDGRTAVCEAQSHPLGLELVVLILTDILRTQAVRAAPAGEALAEEWRQMFVAKGWVARASAH